MTQSSIVLILLAYLSGSVSGAILLVRILYNQEIRSMGSGNPGANNVQRIFGWKPALAVFIFDIIKGVAAVSLVRFTYLEPDTNLYVGMQIILGVSAISGHIFPVFHIFKGGKGVATLTGVLWAIHPYAVLICFSIFMITFIITRYVSLSAIIGITSFPFFINLLFGGVPNNKMTLTLRIFSIVVAIIIWLTHLSNIKRIVNGTEKKFTLKK
jgi:acyl phosphate:glycerol-3-phosphate acyltransferase